MENLSLQNFTSILEVLFVYNTGIAFSHKFRTYLGIKESGDRVLQQLNEYQSFKRFKERENEYKALFLEIDTQKLDDKFIKSSNKIRIFFYENRLEKFLKPFYIYFGVLAMVYLFLAGILDSRMDYLHLMLLNVISTLFAICCLINSFRIGKLRWRSGPIRLFFGSVILVSIPLIVPASWIEPWTFRYEEMSLPDYFIISNFKDFHVIGALLLVMTPVLVELLQILICVFQLRIIKIEYALFAQKAYGLLVKEISDDRDYFDTDGVDKID